jgi:hypothetical protein
MELLEGGPLSTRMKGRPFPLGALLDIAVQVADASMPLTTQPIETTTRLPVPRGL